MKGKDAQSSPTLGDPMNCRLPAPLPTELSRQAHWSEFPCLSSGDLPDLGIEPGSPALQVDSLPSEPPGKLEVHVKSSPSPRCGPEVHCAPLSMQVLKGKPRRLNLSLPVCQALQYLFVACIGILPQLCCDCFPSLFNVSSPKGFVYL